MFKALLILFSILLISYLTVTLPRMLREGKGPKVRLGMFLLVVIVVTLVIIKLL